MEETYTPGGRPTFAERGPMGPMVERPRARERPRRKGEDLYFSLNH